jgi:hypothetical protein
MGTEHPDILETSRDQRPMPCGPVRLMPLSKTTNLLQLEVWSDGSECSKTMVDYIEGLCLPTFLPDRWMSNQGQI